MTRPARPIVLSTWSFGLVANRAAWPLLSSNASALDAVEQACIAVENDESVDSVGRGGTPDSSGRITLDGSIMLSPARSGAVAALTHCPNPVSVARKVMELTPHKLLVGDGANEFARKHGFPPRDLMTETARRQWEEWNARRGPEERAEATRFARRANREEMHAPESNHDTVGVLALDSRGNLAGACSTSGLAFKLPGRVGDSPLVGHGLYVLPGVGAAVTTGRGELMSGACATFLAVERLRSGDSPHAAAQFVLNRLRESFPLDPATDQCGIITLSATGEFAHAALLPGFKVAVTTPESERLLDASKPTSGR